MDGGEQQGCRGGSLSNGSWNSELTARGNGVDIIWDEWTSKDASKNVLLKSGLNALGVGVAIRDGLLFLYRNNGRGFEPAMHFGGGFVGHEIRAIG